MSRKKDKHGIKPVPKNMKAGSKISRPPADQRRDMAEEDLRDREDRIEGKNPALEALRSGRPINKVYIERDNPDPVLARIASLARGSDIPVQYVDRRKLDRMSSARIHQGVILDAAVKEYASVEDILEIASRRREDPFIVILDGITDTNNFGSIIRSAECAGAHGIIIPKRRSAVLNATVAKVAAGAQEFIAIARVANLAQAVRDLKKKGIWIAGADPGGEKTLYEAGLKGPIGLVIGSEGEGISRLIREECDFLVRIPMKGNISSLNAGVAAALMMFEISRQRDAGD